MVKTYHEVSKECKFSGPEQLLARCQVEGVVKKLKPLGISPKHVWLAKEYCSLFLRHIYDT